MAYVIWLTGLSGVGKSTLAYKLKNSLSKKNYKIKILDGDDFRKSKNYKKKFDKISIEKNNNLIIKKLKKIYFDYDFIFVSVISPLKITRFKAKQTFKNNYIEIYLNCTKKVLEMRDPKGLYEKAKKGEIKNLIGYNSKIKYQRSEYPIIKLNTHKQSVNASVKLLLKYISFKL